MDAQKFDELILNAIQEEIAARDFYAAAAEKVADPAVKEILAQLSADEEAHRNTLQLFKSNPQAQVSFGQVEDFGVAETLEMPALSLELKPADAFQLAIKKEQAAMEMYQALAKNADSAELTKMFTELAAMERGHKARLEKLFLDVAYPEVW